MIDQAIIDYVNETNAIFDTVQNELDAMVSLCNDELAFLGLSLEDFSSNNDQTAKHLI